MCSVFDDIFYNSNPPGDIVDLFESYPLMSCKQEEFEIWATAIKYAIKLRRRSSKISLSVYIKHFFDLSEKLDRVRKLND